MSAKKLIKKSALTPTALIAGGAGFIGSALAETLLLKDSRVIVLDNFKTGKKNYVNHLLSNPKFALYDVDINTEMPPEIETVDYVFHLAGLEEYQNEMSLESLLTNAIGTKNLLDLAQKSKAKFVLASSVNVYQGMMSQLSLEQYFGKTNFEEGKYSLNEAKRYAEALVWEYYKKYETDARIVRLPEVYGPKMSMETTGELGRLLTELKEDKNLTVIGDGDVKDYYLFINDAVSGVIKSVFGEKTKGNIYSLVGDEPYSPLEIAYILKGLARRKLDIEFKPGEKEIKPRGVFPDSSNIEDLDWAVKTPFKEGLLKTLSWLGYEANQRSFKIAKLIDDKSKEKASEKEREKEIFLENVSEAAPLFNVSSGSHPHSGLDSISSFHEDSPSVEETPVKKSFPRIAINVGQNTKFLFAAVAALLIFAFVFGLLLPAAQSYQNLKGAYSDIKNVPELLGQADSSAAQTMAESAFQHFNRSQKSISRLKWVFVVTGRQSLYVSLSRSLSSATYFSRSIYYFAKASAPVSSLWQTIRPDSTEVFNVENFEKAKTDFSKAQNDLQLAAAEFKEVNTADFAFNAKAKNSIESYKVALDIAFSNVDLASSAFTGLADIIGVTEPKKYLVLFQNSNEIRPTGGFIGSYAVLELKNGKISNLTIDDVYNPDGQIDLKNIKVPSPTPIQKMLNEPNLHIRNANWNPDFPQSSRDIQDLYYRVTGSKVDGVIALDLVFAKNILDLTGPIFLSAYNEEISAQNLYERAEYHSEFNYTEGSQQKRSFLTVLGSKLLEKMFALPKEKLPEMWAATYASLNGKHLLVYLNNNSFAASLEARGWDGSLVKTAEDYLYVVNANMGGTKANYFVKNEMNYQILSDTRDGLLRGVLTLKYTHTGESDAWPGGPYKDYLRVLTQSGSKLTGAKIKLDGKEAVDLFKEIVIAKVGNYNSFETSFVLNPKEVAEVTFYYDLPQNLSLSAENQKYNLYWQKQPGTEGDKINFGFTAPTGLKAAISPFENVLNTDQKLFVSFTSL